MNTDKVFIITGYSNGQSYYKIENDLTGCSIEYLTEDLGAKVYSGCLVSQDDIDKAIRVDAIEKGELQKLDLKRRIELLQDELKELA